MKKQALLALLPFSMLITGCNGLKKGSIFDEKFMKYNFAEKIEQSEEFVGQKKVDLALGTNVKLVDLFEDVYLKVTDNDDKEAIYSMYENKYILPFGTYGSIELTDETGPTNGRGMRFIKATYTVDTKVYIAIYDQHGTKLGEALKGTPDPDISIQEIKEDYRESNESVLYRITINNEIVGAAIYDLSGNLYKALTPDEYFARKPYSYVETDTEIRLTKYGHEELTMFKVEDASNEKRYQVLDTKKGKFVSSFVVPSGVVKSFTIGKHIIYQIRRTLPSREKKYTYSEGEQKYNVETYKVNYLTGKTSKINTKFVLANTTNCTDRYNKKGICEFELIENIREIAKDKTLKTGSRDIIVNERFKEVADVTGMEFSSLEPLGENYISSKNVIYDNKLKEVGVLSAAPTGNNRIMQVNSRFGLIDQNGKFIYQPKATWLTMITKNYYIANFAQRLESIKIENEKAVVSTFNTEGGALSVIGASRVHMEYTDSESKSWVVDLRTLQKEALLEPATTDVYQVSYSSAEQSGYLGNVSLAGAVYKTSSGSYYAITSSSVVKQSYVSIK